MKSEDLLINKSQSGLLHCRLLKRDQRRRGSIEHVLICVIIMAVLVLPLGLLFSRMMQTWYIYVRAQQTIEQILPSVRLCLDLDALSEGRLRLSYSQVEMVLSEQLERNTPAFLQGLLEIKSVQIDMVEVTPGLLYRYADDSQQHWPVITCYAELIDPRGNTIQFSRSVSCVID